MRGFNRDVLLSVPPVQAGSAYSSGDMLGVLNKLTGVCTETSGIVLLESLVLIDTGQKKAAMEVWFFSDTVTVPADNAAWDLSAADMLKLLGVVKIAATDYTDSTNRTANRVPQPINLPLKAKAGSKDLYYTLVSRGTPTYATVSDLQLVLGLLKP